MYPVALPRSRGAVRHEIHDERGRTVLSGRMGPNTGHWNRGRPDIRFTGLGLPHRAGTYRVHVIGSVTAALPPFSVGFRREPLTALTVGHVVTGTASAMPGPTMPPTRWTSAPRDAHGSGRTRPRRPLWAGAPAGRVSRRSGPPRGRHRRIHRCGGPGPADHGFRDGAGRRPHAPPAVRPGEAPPSAWERKAMITDITRELRACSANCSGRRLPRTGPPAPPPA